LPGFVVALFSVVMTAQARNFRTSFYVPNGNTFGCALCHVSSGGGGPRTSFGEDVNQFVTPNGSQQFWSRIFNLDSDGDGFTNGEEMGDPDGDGRATAGFRASRPWLASSVPAPVNKAPTITVAGDASSAFALRTGKLKLTATAADSDGTVSKVEFFADGTLLTTVTAAPFEFTVDLSTLAVGGRSFTAKATDNQNGATTSTAGAVKLRDPLSMNHPRVSPEGALEISWPSLPGSKYVVEFSEDLVTWKEAGTLVATEAVGRFSEANASAAARFYRAREVE